jgi:uncharacterized membrane protein
MRTTLVLHIAAGSLGLLSGYLALYSTKGAALHRRAGVAFVYAMLAMSAFGAVVTVTSGEWEEVNLAAAAVTAYLVVTGLVAVRPPSSGTRRLTQALMVVALVVGLTELTFGVQAVAAGGKRAGIPAFPFFLFGVIGTLGAVGDVRVLRGGPLRGPARLRRHLWRMSVALLVAAMSFFIGQADVFPKPVRILPLLATPVLAVLVTMIYWLWRVRARRSRHEAVPFAAGLELAERA